MANQVELKREGLHGTLTVEVGPEVVGAAVKLDGEVVKEGFQSHDAAESFVDGFIQGWRFANGNEEVVES